MKNLISPILIFTFSQLIYKGYTQNINGDSHWHLILEDHFDDEQNNLNTSNWLDLWLQGNNGNVEENHCVTRLDPNDLNFNNGKNLIISNSICTLRAIKEPFECYYYDSKNTLTSKIVDYTVGMLQLKEQYKYGYFEILFRIPNSYPYMTPNVNGFSTNFWFWPQGPSIGVNSEIDVFEINTTYFNHFESNLHFGSPNVTGFDINGNLNIWSLRNFLRTKGIGNEKSFYYQGKPIKEYNFPFDFHADFTQFRKVGLQWNPNSIKVFFDGELSLNYYGDFAEEFIPMNLILNIGIPAINHGYNPDDNTLFPFDYEIDYVRIYQKEFDCVEDVYLCQINDYLVYDFEVNKLVNISQGEDCFFVINGDQSVYVNASEEINIYSGFEVQIGSTFQAEVVGCGNN